jgi:segregation and condensation protein A
MPYQVKLTIFQGPLDLLLQLIERRELDITTISLADVADQYLAYIGEMTSVDPAVLTDFLVIAARLILIKSQALLPRPPQAEQPEEDPGQDLVRQLQEYKRFKDVAVLLKQRDEKGLHAYIRLATSGITPRVEIEGVVLDDLADAMRRVLTDLPEDTEAADVARAQFTVAEKIALLEGIIVTGGIRFGDILSGVRSRVEAIVTFLALLEMIKRGSALVEQGSAFGEIVISPGSAVAATAAAAPPPA